jgi:hypothetical protein
MRLDCWSFWRVDRLWLRRGRLGFDGVVLSIAVEAAGLHGGDGLGVLHECLPDKGCPKIFCHQQAYAEIDAEDIGIVPVEVGVEGVAESVAAPGVLTEVFAESAEDADAIAGEERERPGGGRRGP